MRQKKFLHTRRSQPSNYKIFTNFPPDIKSTLTSTTQTKQNSVHIVLDVTKLPKKSSPKKWEEFYTNGRTEFHTGCVLLCSVLISESPFHFWKENSNNPDAHTVVRALRSIESKEDNLQSEARLITFYSSYSPCDKCADAIIAFLQMRPTCKMLLYFTCIYRHNKEREHRDGLRKLCAYSGILELRVFTGKEWQELSTKCGIQFIQNDNFRNYFDNYWKKELDHILMTKEVNEDSWKSLQLPPRLQYLEDGGDPSFIQYESHLYTYNKSRENKRFIAVVDPRKNKKSASAVVVIIIVIVFFITAILSGWISTEGSAAEFQNLTQNT